MLRRLHAPALFIGEIPLDATQTRHARDVLRLEDGTAVEIFDNVGAVAAGVLVYRGTGDAFVRVDRIDPVVHRSQLQLTIAAAVPKGERADWMIEKLSELGVSEFIPLITARGIVKPQGTNKLARWERIATESAKQSRRSGVMQISELVDVVDLIKRKREADHRPAYYLSTQPQAPPLVQRFSADFHSLLLLIGPEGGWTDDEIGQFDAAHIEGARLTRTVLRVETAAVAAAAVVLSMETR